jgi:hypothetical protein
MPFKKINDTLLDAVGWLMILISIGKVLYLVITINPTVKQLIAYFVVAAVGIVFVVLRMTPLGKKIVDTASAIIKKKTGHD